MRTFLALAFSIMFLPMSAFAETPMGNDVYVVADSNLPSIAMAAWNESGDVKTATRADTANVPSNAVKYVAKQEMLLASRLGRYVIPVGRRMQRS
ncbi:MAG: hypothetical protein GKS03_05605 [Alphaproteobacteria bacterium]|nr:hypothetical protein [Alphaproteobacteria bacterium]